MILRKIIKIVARCHQISYFEDIMLDFGYLAGEAHSAPLDPYLYSRWPTSKTREGKERKIEEMGEVKRMEEGKGKEREEKAWRSLIHVCDYATRSDQSGYWLVNDLSLAYLCFYLKLSTMIWLFSRP